MTTASDIARIASDRAFGSNLVTNVSRGLVVEAIVSTALNADWRWCSEDYHRCDFEHLDGTRLEVKQSAACQSWDTQRASIAQWDIAPRTGFWDGAVWVPQPGRSAQIYVLSWHPDWAPKGQRQHIDHRDPAQWRFYAVDAGKLPPLGKTLGIAAAAKVSSCVGIEALGDTVEHLRIERFAGMASADLA